jgi:hypothetical protein
MGETRWQVEGLKMLRSNIAPESCAGARDLEPFRCSSHTLPITQILVQPEPISQGSQRGHTDKIAKAPRQLQSSWDIVPGPITHALGFRRGQGLPAPLS